MSIRGWLPLRLTSLISLLSKGLSCLLQHHSSKASILWLSAFFMVQLSQLYLTTGKTILLLLLSRSVVADSVRPHRRQPTRLHRPWDSPGKNTGVGCHFLLQCVKVKGESEVTQSWPHGLQPTRLRRPWDSPGKSTGMGCHCLLPGRP